MKIQIKYLIFGMTLFTTFCLQPRTSSAQGTAFTYNGSLSDHGKSADGNYDLRFSLFTTAAGGTASAGPITNSTVVVSNGLFATTIDFGVGVFNGTTYWLDISVSPAGSNTFTELTPRQAITPVPYAIFSETAGAANTATSAATAGTANSVSAANVTGTLQLSQLPASLVKNGESGVTLSGAFSGDGSGLTNLSGANLVVGSVGAAQLANGTLAAPVDVTGAINATADTSYVTTNASPTTVFLPANAGSGDVVQITGAGTGAWMALAYSSNWLPTPAPFQTWSSLASSADGTHLVAASRSFDPIDPNPLFSLVYTSTNSGVSWTEVYGSLSWWTSLASSADGTHLIAAANNNTPELGFSEIYTSTNSGASWTGDLPDGVQSLWSSVASSADGTHFVALEYGGTIFASTNSGMNWTVEFPAPAGVILGPLALSSEGTFLAVAGSSGSIYTSTNFGATWSQTSAPSNAWSSLASSSDGSHLVAVADPGGIYTSTNSGMNWTEQRLAPTNATWISVASSSDGTRLVATTGDIYTSTNSGVNWMEQTSASASYVVSSSDGTHLYAINGEQILVSGGYGIVASGVQGGTTSLQYLGNGQWSPESLSQMNFSGAFNGIFSGNGSGLTDLNASQFSGTIPLTQLPAAVLTNNETASVTFDNLTLTGTLDLSTPEITSPRGTFLYFGLGGNSFVGFGAGNPSAESGSDNTADGFNALQLNTSGSGNTAYGVLALECNTNGNLNTADGYGSLVINMSGSGNTASGSDALFQNLGGDYNTADGCFALNHLGQNFGAVGGTNNIALGFQAGSAFYSNESSNIDIGNIGVGGENNTIRIGSSQGQTYIAGVINGNGGGLTNLNLSNYVVNASQLTSIGNTNGGSGNFFVGPNAGNPSLSGSDNSASGFQALANDTTGFANTANGFEALAENETGNYNTAYGFDALIANSASWNTAVGSGALSSNTSGDANTACGTWALGFNTVGSFNTAIGDEVLYWNTSGSGNTANGFQALFANSVGSGNTAIGELALSYNTNGSGNTAVGDSALAYSASGSENTADGDQALANNTSGANNIGIGYEAGINFSGNESSNIDIGNVGVVGENNAIRIGTPGIQSATYIAGVINGNGGGLTNLNISSYVVNASQLTSVGNSSGGTGNYFIGPAGNPVTSGSDNTADGELALELNTSGQNNTAIGFQTLLSNTTGSGNTVNGAQALQDNTTGNGNTADGAFVLQDNTNGFDNTGDGLDAFFSNTSGSWNTGIGFRTLFFNTGGSNNIALGNSAAYNVTNGNNNIEIGNMGLAADNGIIRIGDINFQTACYLAGNVYASGNFTANSVNVTSDRNAKEDFATVNAQAVLTKVASLPVTEWNYKSDKAAEHIGPMAQDFQAAFGLNGQDDKHISIADEGGVALAAIQGLNQKLDQQAAQMKEKDAEIAQLEARLDKLERSMNAK